jgi:hypothetical protein
MLGIYTLLGVGRTSYDTKHALQLTAVEVTAQTRVLLLGPWPLIRSHQPAQRAAASQARCMPGSVVHAAAEPAAVAIGHYCTWRPVWLFGGVSYGAVRTGRLGPAGVQFLLQRTWQDEQQLPAVRIRIQAHTCACRRDPAVRGSAGGLSVRTTVRKGHQSVRARARQPSSIRQRSGYVVRGYAS